MISKKRAAIGLAIGALIGLQLSHIYVPEDFEKPLLYKFIYSYLGITASIARLAEKYEYVTSEAAGIRQITSYFTKLVKIKDGMVKEVDTQIEGVNVRIFTPKVIQSNIPSSKLYRPTMVYFHGGGYAIGDIDAYDAYLKEFVKKLDIIVIAVDYKKAPEHSFPKPIDDCMAVTKYVLNRAEEFGGDSERVILAGDSAGGNAVAVITQSLIKDKSLKNRPKLQLLIYPWVQMVDQLGLPSFRFYNGKFFLDGAKISFNKFISWYIGIKNVTEEIESALQSNSHFMLVDENLRKKYISYLDPKNIPKKYKEGKDYYNVNEIQKKYIYPNRLDEDSIIKKDQNIAKLLQNLFSSEISPLFADIQSLRGLPKTFIIILEWDRLKDECILYAEKLKEAGVSVEVAFYENAFHGQVPFINPILGFKKARDIQNDLIKYVKENI